MKDLEKKLRRIRARLDSRRLDYGVKGMKWGKHKTSENEVSDLHRSYAESHGISDISDLAIFSGDDIEMKIDEVINDYTSYDVDYDVQDGMLDDVKEWVANYIAENDYPTDVTMDDIEQELTEAIEDMYEERDPGKNPERPDRFYR